MNFTAHKLGLLLAVFLTLSACGFGGTDTPNAVNPSDEPTGDVNPDMSPPPITVIEDFIGFTCDKLVECHPSLQPAACESGLLQVWNIDLEIGLNFGQYAYLEDVRDAERTDELVASTSAAIDCLGAIENLSCSAPTVINAYSDSAPDNFNNVYRMIPAGNSCRDIY